MRTNDRSIWGLSNHLTTLRHILGHRSAIARHIFGFGALILGVALIGILHSLSFGLVGQHFAWISNESILWAALRTAPAAVTVAVALALLQRAQPHSRSWAGATTGMFAVALTAVVSGSLAASARGDFGSHIAAARAGNDSYSFALTLVRAGLIVHPWYSGPTIIVIVASVLMMMRAVFTYSILMVAQQRTVSAMAITAMLLIAMPLPPWSKLVAFNLDSMGIYLGQMSPNQWHNVTTMAAVPFAILFLQRLEESEWLTGKFTFKALIAPAIMLSLSTLGKPNGAIAAAPALFAWAASSGRLRNLLSVGFLVLPTALILGVQYVLVFSAGEIDSGRSVLVLDVFRQWDVFSSSIPSSIARSVAFPAAVVFALILSRRRLTHALRFSWLMLLVAAVQFALFSEQDADGNTVFHGNWGWGMIIAAAVLFLYSARDLTLSKSYLARSIYYGTASIAFAHVASGVLYAFIILNGRNFFG